jgi:transposase
LLPLTETLCTEFYAQTMGRPGLAPGIYFRLLLVGYFEGLDSERAMAWRAADSLTLRDFLGLMLPDAPADHSTISRTRRLIDPETHRAVSAWILQRLADAGPGQGDHDPLAC